MKNRKPTKEYVKRRLYAESMGKCMNPDCLTAIFLNNGGIAEKAHIIPYCKTEDNSFENLIILCPNCHTIFDNNDAFSAKEAKSWKSERAKQVSQVFAKKFDTFEELEKVVKPILEENKIIYENYYLGNNAKLWKRSEEKILINNQELKILLNKNRDLFQEFKNNDYYSNLATINEFILHIDEFYLTRDDTEKVRQVLFPKKVNSMFGVEKVDDSLIVSSESLECLISKLQNEEYSVKINLDTCNLEYKKNDIVNLLNLKDAPRVRQVLHDYKCFRQTELRFENLIFILEFLNKRNIQYKIPNLTKLSEVKIKGKLFKFVAKYCLSEADLRSLAPEIGLTIVNLDFGHGTITDGAYELANNIQVNLWLGADFYKKINQ